MKANKALSNNRTMVSFIQTSINILGCSLRLLRKLQDWIRSTLKFSNKIYSKILGCSSL